MLPSPLHLCSLAARTTTHTLIITDSLHSANLYQNLSLTTFPKMEQKISLLRSGLILIILGYVTTRIRSTLMEVCSLAPLRI
ncbi:hypothetical protein PO909_012439 [Leuciscus waleckii]